MGVGMRSSDSISPPHLQASCDVFVSCPADDLGTRLWSRSFVPHLRTALSTELGRDVDLYMPIAHSAPTGTLSDEGAVRAATCMVLLVTSAYSDSADQQRHVDEFLRAGKPVFPILLERRSVPPANLRSVGSLDFSRFVEQPIDPGAFQVEVRATAATIARSGTDERASAQIWSRP